MRQITEEQVLLRREARQHVINGTLMTEEQARAWLDQPGLCACLGGRGCCLKVLEAARRRLSIGDESTT